MRIINVHERTIGSSAEPLQALLHTLSTPDDAVWPGESWPKMRFDGGLAPGAKGGHGPVRYAVDEVSPTQVRFRFTPPAKGFAAGMEGKHWFEVDGATMRHTIDAKATTLGAALRWLFVIRPLHDALVEDALDKASRALGVEPAHPARHSLWVRVLRRIVRRR